MIVKITVFMRIHMPRTVQLDISVPFTEIGGYKFHTETFGEPNKPPIIMVHGGPGQGYDYLYALKELSREYRIVFF